MKSIVDSYRAPDEPDVLVEEEVYASMDVIDMRTEKGEPSLLVRLGEDDLESLGAACSIAAGSRMYRANHMNAVFSDYADTLYKAAAILVLATFRKNADVNS